MKKISKYFVLPLLLMLAAPLYTAADDFLRGDCDQNGQVNIADVTTLIDYLLSGSWSENEPIEPSTTETVTYMLNGIAINMVKVKGGTFMMGANVADAEAYDSEYPAHLVTLSDYYIGETEVTQELWLAVMGSNPSNFTGDLLFPVEKVSWMTCQTFINKLNGMTGQNFRLPTEAEWEYAARGGNKSKGYKFSGSDDINEVAWFSDNSSSKTHPVAQKLPNELGLYDMSGNVYEWCSDWYSSSYYATCDQTNPTGPTTGSHRVNRGGGWYNPARTCRVSNRYSRTPTDSTSRLGLRLAL